MKKIEEGSKGISTEHAQKDTICRTLMRNFPLYTQSYETFRPAVEKIIDLIKSDEILSEEEIRNEFFKILSETFPLHGKSYLAFEPAINDLSIVFEDDEFTGRTWIGKENAIATTDEVVTSGTDNGVKEETVTTEESANDPVNVPVENENNETVQAEDVSLAADSDNDASGENTSSEDGDGNA